MKARVACMLAIFMVLHHREFAFAQATDQPEFRKWDLAGTIGLFGSTRRYFVRSGAYYGEPVTFAGNVDAGRYLTTHLKVDAGVMTTHSRNVYEYSSNYTGQGIAYSLLKVRPSTVTAAFTYQFLENAFAHPYVSVGLGLISISEERSVYSFITPNRVDYLPVVSNERYLRLRPFVAAGYKSYFSERAFIKSEALYAAQSHGFSHATLRVGFGIDF